MSLFVVEHKHSAETCPAGHPEMGPALVKHVSPQNAESFGVTVRGDAVVDGQHKFVLILEAENEEKVRQFMAPFYQAGSVEILPASSCEQVVERAKC
jgi:uncharacterized protein with GYD domain